MQRMKGALLLASLTAALACIKPSPPPVPVEGPQEEVSLIAGKWAGRYWSEATGRRGTIVFSLAEQADTGYGEVEITFSPSLSASRNEAAAEVPEDRPEELPPRPSTTIGITVVRVHEDSVRGTMAPYWDPDCDCRAQTVFEGRVAPDHTQITGTFTIHRESPDRRLLTGRWLVDRER
jgi:hypothetical protein